MSSILNTYNRKKISFKKGKGCYLYSTNGKKYLDFVQGIAVNCLGHSNDYLNNAIKNLYKTNYFKNIKITTENDIILIDIQENPIIQSISFKGLKNKRILKVLNEQIELKEKNSFIKNKVKKDENKISNILRANGFYFSKVSSKLKSNNNNTVDLIYEIDLGEKAFIKKIYRKFWN